MSRSIPAFENFEDKVYLRAVRDGKNGKTNTTVCYADLTEFILAHDLVVKDWREAVYEWAWDNDAYVSIMGSMFGPRIRVKFLVQVNKVTHFRLRFGVISEEEY